DAGHKGLFGRVLVIGGSDEMIGAPAFAGAAALHAGAGLVQIAMPAAVLAFGLAIAPELIGLALPTNPSKWHAALAAANVIAIGPGLGQFESGKELLIDVLKQTKPVVLDADALNIIAASGSWPGSIPARCVLTPHPGEMKRLGPLFGKTEQTADPLDRIDTAVRAAKALRQVIVYKGEGTVVTDGERVYVNRTGSSALSKAGTGDVLTGLTSTLVAQMSDPFNAACAAVWIHGKAGERAGEKFGKRSATARNVIESIAAAMSLYETEYGSSDS
ncbi:MAG TPA: NAD(P)H-hydrate dehydratase, partial [Tepidisphaeraceae bacterium]